MNRRLLTPALTLLLSSSAIAGDQKELFPPFNPTKVALGAANPTPLLSRVQVSSSGLLF